MTKVIAILLAALATSAALAEQPSRESITQPVYVLRAYVNPASSSTYSGIFRYDPVTKLFAPFVPFEYGARYGIPGSVRLGATADRVIVQSARNYEFELATGRLLRRYDSSDATGDGWVFHGVVVTEEQAKPLGIAAGTYGFPFCPYFAVADPCCDTSCVPRQFPGYSAPTLRPFSVLLRRSLDPADLTLTAAKVIGPEVPTNNADAHLPLVSPHTAITLDPSRQQFWMWGAAGNTAQKWATLSVNAGTIGDPMAATVGAPNGIQDVTTLTFHEPSQMLFDVVQLTDLERQFLKQATANAATASSLETIRPNDLTQPRVDAVTAVPIVLPERYVQMIPAVGEVHGLNGTFWRSDLWLYNPADTGVDVTIRRVVRPEQTAVRHIAAHNSLALRNVLSVLGGGATGDGVTLDALVIDAPYQWGAQLSAYSRTFTDAVDGGSYGQAIPAVPSTTGYSTHPRVNASPSYISNATDGPGSLFILDQRQPGRFRHNIGVVNDGATPIEVTLSYTTKKTFSVPPHSVTTVNVESLFAGTTHPLLYVEAGRPAAVWMSVVDNTSQDATFVPFEIFPLPSDGFTEMTIPAVAAVPGANGTSWRTDLFGFLPTLPQKTTLQTNHLDSADGCDLSAQLVPAGIGIYSDIAHQFGLCGTNGNLSGALRVSGSTWMAGYSRTYTTRADGGTFGDMLPFYPSHGWPVQHFSGIEAGQQFRINVGLYNGAANATTNRLLLYDNSGALVAQRDIVLESHASLQSPIGALLNINLAAGLYGLSVVPLGEGRSWAYVSLVDNATGDPTNLW